MRSSGFPWVSAGASTLRMGVGGRLAVAAAAVAGLWLTVAWAVA